MIRALGMRVLAAAAFAFAASAAQAQTEFKTINIVVGSSAGGGYDTYARMLARHMMRYIPGQPSIIVQNMPGASSLKAVQYLDTGAPKDGSVMTAFNPGLLNESLLSADKVRFKFTDVAFVGSITRDLRACYAWGATGIKTFDDLKQGQAIQHGRAGAGHLLLYQRGGAQEHVRHRGPAGDGLRRQRPAAARDRARRARRRLRRLEQRAAGLGQATTRSIR